MRVGKFYSPVLFAGPFDLDNNAVFTGPGGIIKQFRKRRSVRPQRVTDADNAVSLHKPGAQARAFLFN